MDFNIIESLILKIKEGDITSKNLLAKEFRPFIRNFTSKFYIHGYTLDDIENECYLTLFKCINYYNPKQHRFVAYATNSIKNSIYLIIRKSLKRSNTEGSEALLFNLDSEEAFTSLDKGPEDIFISFEQHNLLKVALSKLTKEEYELISFYLSNTTTLKDYAKLKELPYSTVIWRKKVILNKLEKLLKT